MLPLPDLAGFSTCLHCGHATRTEPEPPPPETSADPPTVTISFGSDPASTPEPEDRAGAADAAKQTRRRGAIVAGLVGCLPIVLVLVVVGAIVVGLLKSEGGPLAEEDPSADLYPSGGSALVLPGEPSGPAEVVLVATDNSGGESRRRLVRVTLGPDGGEERWRSEPLPDDVYTVSLASDGEQLYAGAGDEVWNLSLETGEERWRATVTDRVSTSCADCFEVVAGTLVVRTDDAYVTGFQPTSAEPRWSRRLLSPSGGMSVAGPWLVVVDDAEEPSGLGRAITIAPGTGAVTEVVTPTCPASDTVPFPLDLAAGDEVHPVPGTTDVVARFGFGYGCLARWDVTTGAIRWSRELPSGNSFTDPPPLITATELVLALDQGEQVRVDLASGASRPLEVLPDHEPAPRQIVGRTLVADTVTTRGSTRAGIAAWNLDTGERLWDRTLPGTTPLELGPGSSSAALFDGQQRTLLVTTGEEPLLLTFEGKERELGSQAVDVATGELGRASVRRFPTRYDSGTPSVTVESVAGPRMVMTVDSLLELVPLGTDDEIVRWPS